MLGYRDQVKIIAVTWQAARADVAGNIPTAVPQNPFNWVGNAAAVTSEANSRANFKKSVDDLGALNTVNRTANQVSEDRSAAMHRAAEARHSLLGVWKIGDAHRGHMQGNGLAKSYNLVSRTNFNTAYNAWNPN